MFGKTKSFIVRKLVERQLKDASPEQRELILTLVEKNPALFEKISKDIQTEVKAGASQMSAAMKVMPKYQSEIRAIMNDNDLVQRGNIKFNQNGSIHK